MPEKAEWEQNIEHELVTIECPRCNGTATWLRTYVGGPVTKETIDVFTCRTCGHEMHILHDEVPTVAERKS